MFYVGYDFYYESVRIAATGLLLCHSLVRSVRYRRIITLQLSLYTALIHTDFLTAQIIIHFLQNFFTHFYLISRHPF